MLATIHSAVPRGVEALPVRVEVDARPGVPLLTVVGLPDTAIREARERVLTAIRHLGVALETRSIVVNLSPAEERKEGVQLDVAIAAGILAAVGMIPADSGRSHWLIGELSLDGSLRPVRGVLPIVEAAHRAGASVIVPCDNANEAAIVTEATVLPAVSLAAVAAHLRHDRHLEVRRGGAVDEQPAQASDSDLADVAGQAQAKRALEIAAAGGHHLFLLGPPGAGKTMLAQRLGGLLPLLSNREALETTKVYSVTPGVSRIRGLIRRRPFRAPHHTISSAGLVGGGSMPRPGEISLAHNGVLFLDEVNEFRRDVLEVLRQPLEGGQVVIARAAATLTFPARFQLVAAANPCPCGHLGDPRRECRCSPREVARYRGRLSGPLLDRIDIQVEVPGVSYRDLTAKARESSSVVRDRVAAALRRQSQRFGDDGGRNADLGPTEVRRWCSPDHEGERLVEVAVERLAFSARAVHRILKVARTIADLDAAGSVCARHVAEAIAYRALDRPPIAEGCGIGNYNGK